MLLALLLAAAAFAADPAVPAGAQPLPSSKLLLPPVPGEYRPTNSLPVTTAVSPDGRWLVLLHGGFGTAPSAFSQSLGVLDRVTGHFVDVPDPRLGRNAAQTYFLGLAFSSDGTRLYASMGSVTDPEGKNGGVGNGVAVYRFDAGVPTPERFLPIPMRQLPADRQSAAVFPNVPKEQAAPFPAGLAVVPAEGGDRLVVAGNLSDEVFVLDVASGAVLGRVDVGGGRWVPSAYPHSVVATRDGKKAWVSLWNASQVVELDLRGLRVKRRIDLGAPADPLVAGTHPGAMLLAPDEKLLYVALANADRVDVLRTGNGKVKAHFSTRLPGQEQGGAIPDALAFAGPKQDLLLVADAGADALAVLDRKTGKPRGFVPTEWYPTGVTVVKNDVYVTTGKGHSTGPNSGGPLPGSKRPHPYIAAILPGSLARLSLDAATADLPSLTDEVLRSNRMTQPPVGLPFPGPSPIRHVIYVVKENRTYDQVLGDLGLGDGDPSLTLYPESITPNQHALARQFGVLDRFFVSGEISGNGHVWTTAGITSDYTERIWPLGYRAEQRGYDFEGQVNGAYPITMGIPDVDEPATGYLWGNAERHGLTHRNYGEFVSTQWCDEPPVLNPAAMGTPLTGGGDCPVAWVNPGTPLPDGRPNPWPWPLPVMARQTATMPELVGHFDPAFPDFRLDYPDQLRADEFLREFDGWVAARAGGTDPMPQFIVLRFANDHTSGTAPGMPTPAAQVADNDLALGRVVDAISHSAYWDDTAVLVVEDDAQDGADHIDAHRSIAFVVSRFAPSTPTVDSTAYTTVSMIRTLELLVGLPPMNNNDAWAPAITGPLSGAGDHPAFTADWRNRDNGLLYTMNPVNAPGGTASAALDLRHADGADAAILNEILWHDRMGDRPMPAPKHEFVEEEEE